MTQRSALAVTAATAPCPDIATHYGCVRPQCVDGRVPVPLTEPCQCLNVRVHDLINEWVSEVGEAVPDCHRCHGTGSVTPGWASSFMPGDPVIVDGDACRIWSITQACYVALIVEPDGQPWQNGVDASELVLLVPECNTNPLRPPALRYPTP